MNKQNSSITGKHGLILSWQMFLTVVKSPLFHHLGISLAKTPPHSDHEEAVVLWRKELGRGALGHVDICESLALNPCRHCYSPTPFICGASEPGSPMSPSARYYI